MFFCCDPWEEIKRRKYYSKPRKCGQCNKKNYLNYITGLCPMCNQIYIDYLYAKINEMFKQ